MNKELAEILNQVNIMRLGSTLHSVEVGDYLSTADLDTIIEVIDSVDNHCGNCFHGKKIDNLIYCALHRSYMKPIDTLRCGEWEYDYDKDINSKG